jgi:hypothetical protein
LWCQPYIDQLYIRTYHEQMSQLLVLSKPDRRHQFSEGRGAS